MCDPTAAVAFVQPQSGNASAKRLAAGPRQQLAVRALAGSASITQLAADADVSRKFVYQQVDKAKEALDAAFTPSPAADHQVLFYLPVTKAWLRQLILALVLIGHSSFRGVIEVLRDLFDYPISLGTVHHIVHAAVQQARQHNTQQDLARVRHGAHDEIFQASQPVLVGVDVFSSYCYLLSLEEHRDADTWGVRLLELADRGFQPEAIVADFGSGLRAGQALAFPDLPCRGDVFHALQTLEELKGHLENRAYQAMTACAKLERQQARSEQRRGRRNRSVSQKLRQARQAEAAAVALANDVAVLVGWLREDILTVAGPAYSDRCALYDFVVAEINARRAQGPQKLAEAHTLLHNNGRDLLAFAQQLDSDLAAVATEFQAPVSVVRELLNVQALAPCNPQRWQRDARLHQQLGGRYYPLSQAVADLARHTVRASSVIENLNSRLRCYFFLRRHLGADYLVLLQFFLNHRRFLRSEHPERVDKSPAELLTGASHPPWLEMLGYQRFARS